MSLWCEKYRPSKLEDFVCSSTVKEKFKSYIDNKDIMNLLLSGPPGSGKTTLAKIFVKSIPCNYLYINASEERGIETIRERIKDFAYYIGTEDLKICILDEADYTTPVFQAALRNLIESTYEHCRFILTCNYPQKIIDPIKSRCQEFKFTSFSKEQVIERLEIILKNENVVYNKNDVEEIARSTYPDIRASINAAQRCVQDGKLVIDKNSFSESINAKVLELLLQKKWKEIRKLTLEEGVIYEDLFLFLFSEFCGNRMGLLDQKIARILLTIAEKQYRHSMSSSPDINFTSLILEIVEIL